MGHGKDSAHVRKDANVIKKITELATTGGILADPSQEKHTQERFWHSMHATLDVNQSTVGLDVLDQVAEAIVGNNGDAAEAFSEPVLPMPKCSDQAEAPKAYVHPQFSNIQNIKDSKVSATPSPNPVDR